MARKKKCPWKDKCRNGDEVEDDDLEDTHV